MVISAHAASGSGRASGDPASKTGPVLDPPGPASPSEPPVPEPPLAVAPPLPPRPVLPAAEHAAPIATSERSSARGTVRYDIERPPGRQEDQAETQASVPLAVAHVNALRAAVARHPRGVPPTCR